ncbi:MAG: hypothetical protein CVU56_27875 [Deltaproteobacteria bacterium HGW-Deltaproteobacteria-14]|nr:MAG: hypothetical protein CVU56_27875 [Deltaproteobacteria bacterium HGW-Deltaproteobacteria-14]
MTASARASALALSALVVLAAAGCGSDPAPPHVPPSPVAPDLRDRVGFAPLEAATDATLVTLPGEVVLPTGASQLLAPPVAGRLRAWTVALGAEVAAGDVLATFESPDLADLEARERELASVAAARRRLVATERAQLAEGLIGAPSLYEHQLAANEASAQLEAVRAQLASRGSLGADASAEWSWRAPAAGVVAALSCPVGAMTAPDAPCLTLLVVSRAELLVHVPERLTEVVGDHVRAVWHPVSRSEGALDLVLARIDPTIDPLSRTRAHRFAPRPGDASVARWLVPGASGRVDLVAAAPAGVFAVSRDALTRLEGADVLYVADDPAAAPTAARPQPVTVIGRHGELALVRGDGLAPGVQIAVRGVFLLKSLSVLGDGGE